jgi:hypothetical protein
MSYPKRVCEATDADASAGDDLRSLDDRDGAGPRDTYAAAGLREVICELGERYNKATSSITTAGLGPSGALRERIEKGRKDRPFCFDRHRASPQIAGG